ncbi:hypothetical protein BB561_001737 [Smittium simulii]|uniref:Uncharacterized protein n=1 Tax=Smittium simulii TaxID=133385 RepID=A0A2T9YTB0_9FUNG|nr:hypothetical protein BB561_001737 [Smittium simulii]
MEQLFEKLLLEISEPASKNTKKHYVSLSKQVYNTLLPTYSDLRFVPSFEQLLCPLDSDISEHNSGSTNHPSHTLTTPHCKILTADETSITADTRALVHVAGGPPKDRSTASTFLGNPQTQEYKPTDLSLLQLSADFGSSFNQILDYIVCKPESPCFFPIFNFLYVELLENATVNPTFLFSLAERFIFANNSPCDIIDQFSLSVGILAEFIAYYGHKNNLHIRCIMLLEKLKSKMPKDCFYVVDFWHLVELITVYNTAMPEDIPTKSQTKLRQVAVKKLELVSLIVFGDAYKYSSNKFASASFNPYCYFKSYTASHSAQNMDIDQTQINNEPIQQSQTESLGYPEFAQLYRNLDFCQALAVFDSHKLLFQSDGNLILARKALDAFSLFKLFQFSQIYSAVPLSRAKPILSISAYTTPQTCTNPVDGSVQVNASTVISELFKVVENSLVNITVTLKLQYLQYNSIKHTHQFAITSENYESKVKTIQSGKFSNNLDDYIMVFEKPKSQYFRNTLPNLSLESLSSFKFQADKISTRLISGL